MLDITIVNYLYYIFQVRVLVRMLLSSKDKFLGTKSNNLERFIYDGNIDRKLAPFCKCID